MIRGRASALLLLGASTGCLVVPTTEQGLLEGRSRIQAKDQTFLTPGKTTREEALLRLGEPDEVLNGETCFIYQWTVSVGFWFVVAQYNAAGGNIPRTHLLMLEFDPGGRLLRFEHKKVIFSDRSATIDAWTPPEGEKLGPRVATCLVLNPVVPAGYAHGDDFPKRRIRIDYLKDVRPSPAFPEWVGESRVRSLTLRELRTEQPVASLVRVALEAQLGACGAGSGADYPEISLAGELREFTLSLVNDGLAWKIRGILQISMTAKIQRSPRESITLDYRSHVESRPMAALPSKAEFEGVLNSCLQDLQAQINADPRLRNLPK